MDYKDERGAIEQTAKRDAESRADADANYYTGKRLSKLPSTVEVRADGSSKPTKLVGYCAVFNSDSCDMGGFTEQIAPGAFRDCLAAGPDCRMLFNHSSDYVLGRTPKTLTLREDSQGLYFECLMPKTTFAADLMESIQRGDISQCSFGFTIGDDTWQDASGNTVARWTGVKRIITKVGSLFDSSVVTYPAYKKTQVVARAAKVNTNQVDIDAARDYLRSIKDRFSDLREALAFLKAHKR